MHDDTLRHTFQVIRALPPAVELSTVEKLVLAQPAAIYTSPRPGHSWLNFKNILLMTTSASLIGILFLLHTHAPVQTVRQPVKRVSPVHENVQPRPAPPQQRRAQAALPAARKKAAPQAKPQQAKPAAAAPVRVVPVSPVKAAGPAPEAAVPVVAAADTPPAPVVEPAEPVVAAAVACNPRHGIPCHCKCNDGNDVTCTFRDKLRDDGIIGDDKAFSFLIDSKHFVVNGDEQPANVYRKYARVFRELTDHALTGGTYMKVKIEKGNCSISMNYDGDDES